MEWMVTILVLVTIDKCLGSPQCNQPEQYRDTEQLKHLIIGRCMNYKIDYGPRRLCNSNIQCEDLWEKIKKAVEHQPKCNFSANSYQDYILASTHYVPENKFLFWTGVYPFVMRYSAKGMKYFTIADTLTGYIFDNIAWCGNSTEIDGLEKYPATCPGLNLNTECVRTAQSDFWATASINFAEQAYGDVQVMFNASRSPAFRDSSYFRLYELPNINATKVHTITILMVHEFGHPVRENCISPSIITLKSLIKEKGITPVCIENPRDIQLLLCGDDPSRSECYQLVSTSNGEHMTSYIFLLFFCLLLYM